MKSKLFIAITILNIMMANAKADDMPALPEGLGDILDSPTSNSSTLKNENQSSSSWLESLGDLRGQFQLKHAKRIHDDSNQKNYVLSEARLGLNAEKNFSASSYNLSGDFILSENNDSNYVNLRSGEGFFDLRQANIGITPFQSLDIKVGRQIITWGTGDMVFINDLFPKDWNSFVSGQNMEYLKAPTDAIKTSVYSPYVNINLVWVPVFNSDRFITGKSISYYNPRTGNLSGGNTPLSPLKRDDFLDEDELALRVYQNIKNFEVALYAYDGFWKTPQGQNAQGQYYHPKLQTIGASARGPIGPGIFHAEAGAYFSKEDNKGTNPLVRNSETRLLLGYEMELLAKLTAHVQFYQERMDKYDAYKNNLPSNMTPEKEVKNNVIARIQKRALNDNLVIGLLAYHNTTYKDGFLNPEVEYSFTDNLKANTGVKIFYGEKESTNYGQFEKASSIYLGVNYSF